MSYIEDRGRYLTWTNVLSKFFLLDFKQDETLDQKLLFQM